MPLILRQKSDRLGTIGKLLVEPAVRRAISRLSIVKLYVSPHVRQDNSDPFPRLQRAERFLERHNRIIVRKVLENVLGEYSFPMIIRAVPPRGSIEHPFRQLQFPLHHALGLQHKVGDAQTIGIHPTLEMGISTAKIEEARVFGGASAIHPADDEVLRFENEQGYEPAQHHLVAAHNYALRGLGRGAAIRCPIGGAHHGTASFAGPGRYVHVHQA